MEVSYTIAVVGEYVTSRRLYSAHKLCQITWHSGLLASWNNTLLWEFVAFHRKEVTCIVQEKGFVRPMTQIP